ncbi:hypothetical protein T08_2549 [Trichinella sp. T8]|uniref:Uncharacterized protein n=1 Tax=Trichinella murrelli TaxID=144512 RepID=A0A0V0T9A1_9BILA|nr:hypothetical protein T05_7080 [Trichinella murrelli]KRZ84011.1 hypothetical protein T08_2549 [Trichinella sp. T8]
MLNLTNDLCKKTKQIGEEFPLKTQNWFSPNFCILFQLCYDKNLNKALREIILINLPKYTNQSRCQDEFLLLFKVLKRHLQLFVEKQNYCYPDQNF